MKERLTNGLEWARDGAFCLHSSALGPAPLRPGLDVMRPSLAILLAVVMCGMSCVKEYSRMRTFSIGSTKIDLPGFLETRVENDTLVAFPPRTDFANLRFTVISVTKDGEAVGGAGEKMIRERAIEAK